MPPHRSVTTQVAKELHNLAKRGGLERVFDKLGAKQVVAEITTVLELAKEHFPSEWESDRVGALECLLRRGISMLDGRFGDISRREAALRIFNLNSLPGEAKKVERLHLDGQSYRHSYILRVLQSEANIIGSDSHLKIRVRELRQRLARVLVDPPFTSVDGPHLSDSLQASVTVRDAGPSYIRRQQYHDEFDAGLARGYRVFLFYGLPGVGKSRLVDEIAAETAARVGAVSEHYDCSDADGFVDALTVRLDRDGFDVDNLTERQLIRAFINRLYIVSGSGFTVLQNIRDGVIVKSLDVARVANVLVLTSDSDIKLEDRVCRIQVHPPTTEEATDIASQLLPKLKSGDLLNLIDRLGSSPQVLESAAVIMSHEGASVTVDALSRAFTRNAPAILRGFDSDLSNRLEVVLSALRAGRPGAAETLERMLLLGDSVPIDLLVACAVYADGFTENDQDIVRVLVERNLQVLVTYSLITQDDQVVRLYKAARLVGRALIQTERGRALADELRITLLKRIVSAVREDGKRSLAGIMDAARGLIYQLFYVEYAATNGQDEDEASRAVAKAIHNVFGELDFGTLVKVKPVGTGENFVMLRLTTTPGEFTLPGDASTRLSVDDVIDGTWEDGSP